MTEPQPLDLAPIQARHQAATPGPWPIEWDTDDVSDVPFPVSIGPLGYLEHRGEREAADAEFIAAARQDVPALIDEVLRLRAENDELVEQRERRRSRLIALQNDALDIRGSLSPNGEDPKVPFPLGETLTPAVDWLISRVAELEQQIAELTMTPRERANAHCRALLAAGDYEGATAYAEAFEASEAHALANTRP